MATYVSAVTVSAGEFAACCLLGNGNILNVGASSAGALIYNPTTGTTTYTSAIPIHQTQCIAGTDGNAYIAGNIGTNISAYVYQFNYTTSAVTQMSCSVHLSDYTTSIAISGNKIVFFQDTISTYPPPAENNKIAVFDISANSLMQTAVYPATSQYYAGVAADFDGNICYYGDPNNSNKLFKYTLSSNTSVSCFTLANGNGIGAVAKINASSMFVANAGMLENGLIGNIFTPSTGSLSATCVITSGDAYASVRICGALNDSCGNIVIKPIHCNGVTSRAYIYNISANTASETSATSFYDYYLYTQNNFTPLTSGVSFIGPFSNNTANIITSYVVPPPESDISYADAQRSVGGVYDIAYADTYRTLGTIVDIAYADTKRINIAVGIAYADAKRVKSVSDISYSDAKRVIAVADIAYADAQRNVTDSTDFGYGDSYRDVKYGSEMGYSDARKWFTYVWDL